MHKSPESSKLYVDDEILNIIDIIWDWYEDNGLLDIDTEADDEDVNTNALIKHVRKMLSKDPDSPRMLVFPNGRGQDILIQTHIHKACLIIILIWISAVALCRDPTRH